MPQLGSSTRRDTVRIYLVRHGETNGSLTGPHTGRTDVALTSHGEDQARAFAPETGAVRFPHVLTSRARRLRRTCAPGATTEIEPDLAEWGYEGKHSTTILEGQPGCSDGCRGDERPPELTSHAGRIIARLQALESNVTLFFQGQFGCCLGAHWSGLPVVDAWPCELSPASVSVLRVPTTIRASAPATSPEGEQRTIEALIAVGALSWNPSRPGLAVVARWRASPGRIGPWAKIPGRSIPGVT